MPQKCSVCVHAKRAHINKALLNPKRSLRDIADQYQVSRASLGRHRAHLTNAVQVAKTNGAIEQGRTVYEQFDQLMRDAEKEYKAAKGMVKVAWFGHRWRLLDRAFELGFEAGRMKGESEFKDVTPDVLDIINAVNATVAQYEAIQDAE